MLKHFTRPQKIHLLLLLLWILLGAALRFIQIGSKALWDDEFATIVFSLGHSFLAVPIDQVITLGALLQPLQFNSPGNVGDVLEHLMTESTHPPIYFVLNHWWMQWMQLFSASNGWVDAWTARSLSTVFGVLSIPAMFGLGWLVSRSPRVAQVAAALMAVSPFGVYLAQEARHYTLAVLWVIASLACLVTALGHIQQRRRLPLWVGVAWVLVNSLGIATHYFFCLTLCAEAIVVLGAWLLEFRARFQNSAPRSHNPAWYGIYAVAAGTLVGSLVWLFALQGNQYESATRWAFDFNRDRLEWLYPIQRTLTGIISMFALIPLYWSPKLALKILTVVAFCYGLWLTLRVVWGLKPQLQQPTVRWMIYGSAGLVAGVMVVLCLLDYLLGARITTGLRYHFSYFPAAILLVAAGLANQGRSLSGLNSAPQRAEVQSSNPANAALSFFLPFIKDKSSSSHLSSAAVSAASGDTRREGWTIGLVLAVGTISALAVCFNLTFQKVYRPDLVAPDVQSRSQAPVLISIPQPSYSKMRRLMALGYELKAMQPAPRFYFDSQASTVCLDELTCGTPTPAFRQAVAELPRPLDIWLIDFNDVADLTDQQCLFDAELGTKQALGYHYQRYHCPLRQGAQPS
jgi:uncharacterized membrane protein